MASTTSDSRETEFYRKLRRTVRIWAGGEQNRASQYADYILASPDLFMLLTLLARDNRVSAMNRAKVKGAIAYFVNPLDLMPELLFGPAGLVDDIALTAYVLHDLLETTDPSVIQEHWEGSADILDLVRQILAVADAMVGGPMWRRITLHAQAFAQSARPTTHR